MTIGNSSVVAQFLKEAARVRKFQVIVAETAPLYPLLYAVSTAMRWQLI